MISGAISLSEVIEKLDSKGMQRLCCCACGQKTAPVDVRVCCLLAYIVHATEL